MIWKPPETEQEWQECLSAYLDGELSTDEKTALENHLKNNPERTEQLAELRKLGSLLPQWEMQIPQPDKAFQEKLLATMQRPKSWKEIFPRSIVLSWKLRLVLHAAVFLLGICVGAILMNMIGKTGEGFSIHKTPSKTTLQSIPAEKTPGIISDSQAKALLKEIDAEQLKEKMMDQIKRQNWDQASTIYKSLREQYSDTKAWKDLENEKSLGTVKKLPFSRRFFDEVI